MKLDGKKIAILGGTQISCEIVKAAKKLGMHTTVIDYYPSSLSPAKQISDEQALISVADVKEVASYIQDNSIDGVITGYTDSILAWYADICELAQLPSYGTRRQFEIFTDKNKWKQLCHAFGVPTSRDYNGEELLEDPYQASYPLMVKPADGSGSKGVFVVESPNEFQDLYNKSLSFSKNKKVLVEDYLLGPEVTVFWLFINGRYEVFLLGNRHVKHNQEDTLPLPAGYTFPASVLPRYLDEVAPNVRRMLASQGIHDGMMFMQCVVCDGLPFVYDIGFRLTGTLEHLLTAEIADFSPVEMLLCYAVTGQMTDDLNIWQKVGECLYKPCFNISCLMKPGTIDHFEGLEKLDDDPHVIGYVKAHVEGETLPPEAKGQLRQIALRILGRVDASDQLKEVMLSLQEEIRIVSSDGENLMLPGLDSSDFSSTILSCNSGKENVNEDCR